MSTKKIILLGITITCLIGAYFLFKNTISFVNHNNNRDSVIADIISGTLTALICFIVTLFWNKLPSLFLFGQDKASFLKRIDNENVFLANLIARFEKELPWEIDKFTDLAAIQEDINSYARKGKSKVTTNNYEVNEPDSNVNIRRFLEKEKGTIMLKGEPGTGKTITVRRFAADIAKKSIKENSGNAPIPLFVSLNAYNKIDDTGKPIPFIDFLEKYLDREYSAFKSIKDSLSELLLHGRFIIIFDGLNELPSGDFNARLAIIEDFVFKGYPKNRFIITCRTILSTSLYQYTTLEINELNDHQIKNFIRAYRGDAQVNNIFNQISKDTDISLSVFRNPFMLRMYLLRNTKTDIPSTLGELYSQYIYDTLTKYENDQIIINTLKEISFALQQNGLFAGEMLISEIESFLGKPINAKILSTSAKANLTDTSNDGRFRFNHQILQEYFSALKLYDLYSNKDNYDSYLADEDWEETILVMGSIMKQPSHLIKEIFEKKHNDRSLFLAIKLCAYNKARIDISLYNEIIKTSSYRLNSYSLVDKVETLKAISVVKTEEFLKLISETLITQDGWIREICIQILGKSEDTQSREVLINSLKSLDSNTAFLQARYFLPFNLWIKIFFKSRLSLLNLISYFGYIWQYAFILVPFIFFSLIGKASALLTLNPTVFVGRLTAVIFIIRQIISKVNILKANKRNNIQDKMQLYSYSDLIFVGIIACLWFFPAESLALFSLTLLIAILAYTGFVVFKMLSSLTKISRLASTLLTYGSAFIMLIFILVATRVITVINPKLMSTPDNFTHINNENISVEKTHESAKSNGEDTIKDLIPYRNISEFEGWVYRAMSFLRLKLGKIWLYTGSALGILSLSFYVVSYILFMKLKKYKKAWQRNNQNKALINLISAVSSDTYWPKIKIFALKQLRDINLSPDQILHLESCNPSDYYVERELERTIYEIKQKNYKRS